MPLMSASTSSSPSSRAAMPFPAYKLWVFDLDGTLIDSRLDLVHAVNATLKSLDRAPLGEARVLSFVGDGAEDLLLKSLIAAGIPEEEARGLLPSSLAWFLDYYGDHCLDYTVPYPGAMELLDRLDGVPMAVLTNKPLKPALKILEHLGILNRFAHIIPGDGPLGKKPDPRGMAYILESMKFAPSEAVLIGDSHQDLLTARAAKTGFIAFWGGLGDLGPAEPGSEPLIAASPELTHAVSHLSEIMTLLEGASA